jgi:hypothetical protein
VPRIYLRLAIRTVEAQHQAQGQAHNPAQSGKRAVQAMTALKNAHQCNVFFFGKTSQRTKNALGWTNYIFDQLGMFYENKVAFVQAWGLDPDNHALVMNGPHTTPQEA